MTSDDEFVPWLRERIRERLEAARKACERTVGHWWRRESDWRGDGTLRPVGHLYAGERIADEDGGTAAGEFIVVYCEGAPSEGQFDHMERNDPRDTIARCEFELAVLGAHRLRRRLDDAWCAECHREFPCRTVRLLGYGYRFRPGYREAWKP